MRKWLLSWFFKPDYDFKTPAGDKVKFSTDTEVGVWYTYGRSYFKANADGTTSHVYYVSEKMADCYDTVLNVPGLRYAICPTENHPTLDEALIEADYQYLIYIQDKLRGPVTSIPEDESTEECCESCSCNQ